MLHSARRTKWMVAALVVISCLLVPSLALAGGHGRAPRKGGHPAAPVSAMGGGAGHDQTPFHYQMLGHRHRDGLSGAVYVNTNETSNTVAAFWRDRFGTLEPAGEFSTGGSGTGAGLGSQGAIAMSADGKWLVSVNASSDDLSVFSVRKHGQLKLVDTAPSMGTMPISVSVVDHVVYVLNDGGSGNIAGFRLGWHGQLNFITGSVQPLSNGGVGSAPVAEQIGINPWRSAVVVTEKSTGMIDVYPLSFGMAGAPTTFSSVGGAPYGFAFSKWGRLVVSEAASNSVSSYRVGSTSLDVVSPSVMDSGTAPCWVTISPDGHFVYVSDAHSNDLSIYRLRPDGTLSLVLSPAATVNTPLDLDTTQDGRFLYVLGAGSQTIDGFKIKHHGMLDPLGSLVTIPASTSGLVAW